MPDPLDALRDALAGVDALWPEQVEASTGVIPIDALIAAVRALLAEFPDQAPAPDLDDRVRAATYAVAGDVTDIDVIVHVCHDDGHTDVYHPDDLTVLPPVEVGGAPEGDER